MLDTPDIATFTGTEAVGGSVSKSPVAFSLAVPVDATAWKQRMDNLQHLRELADDWDGEGSKAPGANLVDSAIAFARSLMKAGHAAPDRVFASVNGTVYLEWHTSQGYQEIEVTAPGKAELRQVPTGSKTASVMELLQSA